MAVQAHVRGALDFGESRRYRVQDALRKRLVYEELDRETVREVYRAAYCKLSWFIPVAENRGETAKKAGEMYRKYIDALVGEEVAGGGVDYRTMWENYWGVKLDSPEWKEEERRILLDQAMRKKMKGGKR
jgi:hypothetical protein